MSVFAAAATTPTAHVAGLPITDLEMSHPFLLSQ
jgi:hypothetical protein